MAHLAGGVSTPPVERIRVTPLVATDAAERFTLPGPIESMAPLGHGLIHRSYLLSTSVKTAQQRYVLQEINTRVFPDPEALMENVACVLDHLARTAGPGQRVLQSLSTHDGASWIAEGGRVWRMFAFLENTKAIIGPPTVEQASQIGRAFGGFLDQMRTFPIGQLRPVIAGYRDTAQYLEALNHAVRTDPLNRAREMRREVSAVQARTDEAMFLHQRITRGALPQRAVHGDAKLDNVLLDQRTDQAVCVIDLDTVMPGSLLHDLADCLRELLVRVSPSDVFLASSQAARIEALVGGFVHSLSVPPTSEEIDGIVRATLSITLELAIRFATDYLLGGLTFRAASPQTTADRARQHLRLAQQIEAHQSALEEIVVRAASGGQTA